MEPMFFVMAILGCGDGNAQCVDARIEPVHYATAAQCQADLAEALERNTDLSYPVLSATCRSRGMQIAANVRTARRG